MKQLFRSLIVLKLTLFAKLKLYLRRPILIGITGSVGKTSTKDAIVAILEKKYHVKAAKGGYNTEVGIPLMLLNQESPQSTNPLAWFAVLWRGFFDIFNPEPMDVVVVEMGVDKPGDMRPLTWLIHPTIAVLTNVSNVHIAPGQFSGEKEILQEKAAIAAKQSGQDIFITNNDNTWIAGLEHHNSTRVSYGSAASNAYVISHVQGDLTGIHFHLSGEGVDHDFHVPILGTFHVSVLVPAIIIGLKHNISPEEIQESIATFQMPKGRMRILDGAQGARIIDSSYNASPIAVTSALHMIDDLKAPRKILCLGQMNELGQQSELAHREIGRLAAQIGDMFILVGKDTQFIQEELLKHGVDEQEIHYFVDSKQAGAYLRPLLQPEDLIFVKGSQNAVRLERLIAEILQNPELAPELLVRQGPAWQ